MKLRNLMHVLLAAVLLSCIGAATADDTDLFNQPPGATALAPNILFVLDNTSNWSRDLGATKAGTAELLAIKNFVGSLTNPTNVGLVMYTTTGHTGGYVRFGLRDMSNSAKSTAFKNIVGGISITAPEEKVNQNSGGIAGTLYEVWRYVTGASSWAGMDALADRAGNTGLTAAGQGLTSDFAYTGSSAGSRYQNPIAQCAKTYIIFIGNNGPAASPYAPASTDPSVTTLASYTYTVTPDIQSTWTRFLRLRPDLGAGSAAAASGAVTTYVVNALNGNQNDSYTAILHNMAKSGGGQYFEAASDTDIQNALNKILAQIQAVNSVFASASLPVSVSVRGTFLNQVYLGVFRPDPQAQPNWTGNLKQYKLGVNTSVTPPALFLSDSVGTPAENPTTGFVNPTAISYWTQSSTFWDPVYFVKSQGVGGSSDSPDGDLVEKGGAAQYIRTAFPSGQGTRKVYTCTGTCGAGSPLASTPFTTTNTAITSALLNATSAPEHDAIINWVRGGNVNLDDPANPSAATTGVRGFAHGDVLHSRPAVINYNRTSDDIVVYYGANDGMLHAVKGGQDTANHDGNELWSFVAAEHFSQLKRLRDHSPVIAAATPKPYFMDGSPVAYVYSTANDGKIDSTRGDKAYLFIPMRRGGRFIYALDVSDPTNPKMLWKHSSADSGFAELGQSWSDLRVAKLRYQSGPVLIFGLGNDAAANDPIAGLTATMGRGVMVLDAVSGTPIWQAGPAPTGATYNTTVSGMTYAIPATAAIYDSDGDGTIDRIYIGDTGANLWRINVNDASPSNWTVTKLAALGGTGANARKFLFQSDIIPADPTHTFDALLIGSGDREHPFDSTIQNRYYMIKDDHGLLATRLTPIIEGTAGATTGVAGTLYDATANLVQVGTAAQVTAANTALAAASGWYVSLGTGEKVVGGSTTLAGTTFFGTNTPTAVSANACVGNLGEARLYALSYLNGSATTDENQNGVLTSADRSVIRAGGGYPPTPVPISVVIGSGTYQGAISGSQVLTAPGPALGRRYPTFWQRLIDAN